MIGGVAVLRPGLRPKPRSGAGISPLPCHCGHNCQKVLVDMTVTVSDAEGYEPIWGGFINRFKDLMDSAFPITFRYLEKSAAYKITNPLEGSFSLIKHDYRTTVAFYCTTKQETCNGTATLVASNNTNTFWQLCPLRGPEGPVAISPNSYSCDSKPSIFA